MIIYDYMKPRLIQQLVNEYAIRFNLEEVEMDMGEPEGTQAMWGYEEVFTPTLGYDNVVSALIGSRYSVSEELSIINDRVRDGEDTEEWNVYQNIRAWAKAYARDELGLEK